MKFKTLVYLMGLTILVTGCGKEQSPSAETDAWEMPAENAAAPETTADTNEPAKVEELPPGVVAIVKGSAFKIEGTTETAQSVDEPFYMSHYFTADAPVELKTSATLMETDLEGGTANDSVPIISLRLTSTAGAYREFSADARPVDGKQLLQDNFDIGPGSYNMNISYFSDTVGQMRPRIILNSVTFRNIPAPAAETPDNQTTAPE